MVQSDLLERSKSMAKKISIFFVILVLGVTLLGCYLTMPSVQEKIASWTEEDFQEENIYSDIESVSQRLDEEIIKGSESFIIYLKDMEVNEINEVNASLDGIFGSGESYQQIGAVGDNYKKVEIHVKRTTNYYVYNAYVNNEPVPEGEEKAKALYKVVKSILDSPELLGATDYEKELFIHDYLVKNCKYSQNVKQSADSDIYRAYGALVNQDAVCNGYAEAMQLMFMCAGLESKFVTGTAGELDHAWNMVKLDGKWYHVDATWNDPKPDQGNDLLHPYFNVSDTVLKESHTWNQEKYPAAEDMAYNYYVMNNDYFKNFDEYKEKAYEVMVSNGQNRYEAVIENYTQNEEDIQFLFEDNFLYSSATWQSFKEGAYHVLILEAE